MHERCKSLGNKFKCILLFLFILVKVFMIKNYPVPTASSYICIAMDYPFLSYLLFKCLMYKIQFLPTPHKCALHGPSFPGASLQQAAQLTNPLFLYPTYVVVKVEQTYRQDNVGLSTRLAL